MKIDILAVGKGLPDWVNQGSLEYFKRLPKHWHVNLVQISPARRDKSDQRERYKQEEGALILQQIRPQDQVIALDVIGKSLNTLDLSHQLGQWLQAGQDLKFIIGGPDGLDPRCLERANLRWSLSPLTFPHPLVRVILAEQLYRAWTLLTGHPYHRD